MPYIKKEIREMVDPIISEMLGVGVEPDGTLNYILYKFCKEWVQIAGESYGNYQRFFGELESCKAEIYRRQVAPYEEIKARENGDI